MNVMRFLNFELSVPVAAIEILAFGYNWDLHNFADFKGFAFVPSNGNVVFEWRLNEKIMKEQKTLNGWGDPNNLSKGCKLIFDNVTFLKIKKGSSEYPPEEGDCVANICKRIPGEDKFPFKNEWTDGEPFHLYFEFQNESEIEICADTVTFEAII